MAFCFRCDLCGALSTSTSLLFPGTWRQNVRLDHDNESGTSEDLGDLCNVCYPRVLAGLQALVLDLRAPKPASPERDPEDELDVGGYAGEYGTERD